MQLNTIHCGDALTILRTLPSQSVHCCVTSPPYYGLRDYGTAKWKGGNDNCTHTRDNKRGNNSSTLDGGDEHNGGDSIYKQICAKCGAIRIDDQIGLEETPELYIQNLTAVFEEVHRVLRDDGTLWLNLGDSYWGGKGQSGSSGAEIQGERHLNGATLNTDYQTLGGAKQTRPTDRKHPSIKPKDLIGIPWMAAFALRAAGWYLRQDLIWSKPNPMPESVTDRCTKSHEYIFLMSKAAKYYYDQDAIREPCLTNDNTNRDRDSTRLNNTPGRTRMGGLKTNNFTTANKRSVWTVTTKPFKEGHFATFPPDLIVDCIRAGCMESGIVLDPFIGAGTTALVARKLNRNFIGIELNPEYITIANHRLQNELGLFM